jgi:DNA polymerase/3'-5' exonuclease PolX
VEIAGSVRRGKPEVGDIEIVCIPIIQSIGDMFGETVGSISMVDVFFGEAGEKLIKSGPRYKQVALKEGINLDLFMVIPPAQFGVLFVIRTGPAEYSHKFVTPRKFGGMMPSNMQVKDGAIWCNGKIIETPEEQDVYRLIGAEWIAPDRRMA